MKKISEELEQKIQDYIKGELSPAEKHHLEEELRQNEALKTYFNNALLADQYLKITTTDQPSKNFTGVVMGRLNQYPQSSGFSIRNGLMLLCGMLIITVLSIILLSSGIFDQQTVVDLRNVNVGQRYIQNIIPKFSIDLKTLINIILVLNIALSFVVLDRTILKPLFNRRLQTGL